jgi:acetyl esterase/lipase
MNFVYRVLSGSVLFFTVLPEPAKTEDVVRPAAVSKIQNHFDISYQTDASGTSAKADLRIPEGEAPKNGYPVVIVVHGGAWAVGDKWTMGNYAHTMTTQGIATLTMNYRHAPEFQYPAQVDDVRSALVWIHDHAAEYQLDLQKVGVSGYSAGGHLALMVATMADEPREVQLRSSRWPADDPRWQRLPKIAAVCAGGPPCEFRNLPPRNSMLAFFLGGSREELPDVYESASPVAHASAKDPATRLVHGEDDTLVPIVNSREMNSALQAAGVQCELVAYPKLGHMTTFMHDKTAPAFAEFFARQFADVPMERSQKD